MDKITATETQHFQKKLPCHYPVLKQIEKGVQNGTITKNVAQFFKNVDSV